MANIREEYNFSMNPLVTVKVAKETKQHFTWSAYLGGTLVFAGILLVIWSFLPIKNWPDAYRFLTGGIGAAAMIAGIILFVRFPRYWITPDENWDEMNQTEQGEADENP